MLNYDCLRYHSISEVFLLKMWMFDTKYRRKRGKLGPGYGHILFLFHVMCSGGCEMLIPTFQVDCLPVHSISGLRLIKKMYTDPKYEPNTGHWGSRIAILYC